MPKELRSFIETVNIDAKNSNHPIFNQNPKHCIPFKPTKLG